MQWQRPTVAAGPEEEAAGLGPAAGDRMTRTGRVVPEQAVGDAGGTAAGPHIPGEGTWRGVERNAVSAYV